MARWWWMSPWGWISYESALARGDPVAYGMAYAFFIGGRCTGKGACRGTTLGKTPD